MGLEYRNSPWWVSTFSTAAGILLEQSQPATTDMQGRNQRRFRLRGFSISGTSVVAVSTTPIKVVYGYSSIAPENTVVLCHQPGASMIGASGLVGVEGGYIAIESTIVHADGGLVVTMWGD